MAVALSGRWQRQCVMGGVAADQRLRACVRVCACVCVCVRACVRLRASAAAAAAAQVVPEGSMEMEGGGDMASEAADWFSQAFRLHLCGKQIGSKGAKNLLMGACVLHSVSYTSTHTHTPGCAAQAALRRAAA